MKSKRLCGLSALDRVFARVGDRARIPPPLLVFGEQDSKNMPYHLGPYNQYDANSTYLSPYDWLYGPYAPPFVLENFDDLAFSEVCPGVIT